MGTLNTNIGNASPVAPPVPEDYRGSPAETMMETVRSRKFVGGGDKTKAATAIVEVVVGRGAGAGHDDERFVPLGPGMLSRITLVRDQLDHAVQTFGETCEAVVV